MQNIQIPYLQACHASEFQSDTVYVKKFTEENQKEHF